MGFIVLYACLVLGLAALVMRKPAYAMAIMICMFGFEQWSMTISTFFVTYSQIGQLAAGGVLVLALVTRFAKQKRIFGDYPLVFWFVVALYVLATLSVAWSMYPLATVDRFRFYWAHILSIVILTPMLAHEARDLYDGLMGTLLFGSVLVGLLILTTKVDFRLINVKYVAEVGERRANPLAIAQMCGMIALIALLMNFKGVARVWQILRWGVAAVAISLILRSGSRGEFLAMLLTAVIFIPFSRRITSARGILSTIVAALIVGAAANALFLEFAIDSYRWQADSLEDAFYGGRWANVETLLEYWASSSPLHWLVGIGNSASYDANILGRYPHVVPVEILAEEGLIGFVLFCGVCVLCVRAVIRTYPLVKDHPEALGVLAALAGVLFFRCVISCKTSSFLGSQMLFLFAILLGKYEMFVLQFARQSPQRTPPLMVDPPTQPAVAG